MLTITTKSINNRPDWYHATATIHGRIYTSWETTRHAAFMAIARQLIVAGHIKGGAEYAI